jgi:hypothetical protein
MALDFMTLLLLVLNVPLVAAGHSARQCVLHRIDNSLHTHSHHTKQHSTTQLIAARIL